MTRPRRGCVPATFETCYLTDTPAAEVREAIGTYCKPCEGGEPAQLASEVPWVGTDGSTQGSVSGFHATPNAQKTVNGVTYTARMLGGGGNMSWGITSSGSGASVNAIGQSLIGNNIVHVEFDADVRQDQLVVRVYDLDWDGPDRIEGVRFQHVQQNRFLTDADLIQQIPFVSPTGGTPAPAIFLSSGNSANYWVASSVGGSERNTEMRFGVPWGGDAGPIRVVFRNTVTGTSSRRGSMWDFGGPPNPGSPCGVVLRDKITGLYVSGQRIVPCDFVPGPALTMVGSQWREDQAAMTYTVGNQIRGQSAYQFTTPFVQGDNAVKWDGTNRVQNCGLPERMGTPWLVWNAFAGPVDFRWHPDQDLIPTPSTGVSYFALGSPQWSDSVRFTSLPALTTLTPGQVVVSDPVPISGRRLQLTMVSGAPITYMDPVGTGGVCSYSNQYNGSVWRLPDVGPNDPPTHFELEWL